MPILFILVSDAGCRYSACSRDVPIICTKVCPTPLNAVTVHILGSHRAIRWHLLEIGPCFKRIRLNVKAARTVKGFSCRAYSICSLFIRAARTKGSPTRIREGEK